MEKVLCWDMDGTMNKFYDVPDWLPKLRAESVEPYTAAEPMFNMDELKKLLVLAHNLGYRITIVSWGSMGASRAYNRAIRKAKLEWLERMGIVDCFDEIHVTKYGTPKHYLATGLLIDDNATIRGAWERRYGGGTTMNPLDDDFLEALTARLKED